MAVVDRQDQGFLCSAVAMMKEGHVRVPPSDVMRLENTKPNNPGQVGVAAIAHVNFIEIVSAASNELEASTGKLTAIVASGWELAVVVTAADSEDGSANLGREAVDEARKTSDELAQSAIGALHSGELISTIVGQINLLGLKATIEAMRAGEADCSFAVLAWKALAEQTAKAIGEISRQTTGIQEVTSHSVDAFKAISSTIQRMSRICSVIACAAEEQGGATREIYRTICAYQNIVQKIRWQADLSAFPP